MGLPAIKPMFLDSNPSRLAHKTITACIFFDTPFEIFEQIFWDAKKLQKQRGDRNIHLLQKFTILVEEIDKTVTKPVTFAGTKLCEHRGWTHSQE